MAGIPAGSSSQSSVGYPLWLLTWRYVALNRVGRILLV